MNNSLAMEPWSTQDATKCATQILDAKYNKADLQSIAKENCKHLSTDQQKKLLQLLRKYELLLMALWVTGGLSWSPSNWGKVYYPIMAELS